MAKTERTIVPTTREGFDNERVIFVNISNPLNKNEAFEIVWDVPKAADGIDAIEAFLKDRYNCTLDDLMVRGVRNISTAPNYVEQGFDGHEETLPNGRTKFVPDSMKVDGHAQMQALADDFRCGTRTAANPTQKALAEKAKAAESAAAKLGFGSLEEMLERAKELGLTA